MSQAAELRPSSALFIPAQALPATPLWQPGGHRGMQKEKWKERRKGGRKGGRKGKEGRKTLPSGVNPSLRSVGAKGGRVRSGGARGRAGGAGLAAAPSPRSPPLFISCLGLCPGAC